MPCYGIRKTLADRQGDKSHWFICLSFVTGVTLACAPNPMDSRTLSVHSNMDKTLSEEASCPPSYNPPFRPMNRFSLTK